MKAFLFLAITAMLLLPLPAANAGSDECDPKTGHCEEACKDRNNPCTDVNAGKMSCMSEAGTAAMLTHVVGSQDHGTFRLSAEGTNFATSGSLCKFEIRIDPSAVDFNTAWVPDLAGSPGAVTSWTGSPCTAVPGTTCTAQATFDWWRAVHGVTFDVPYSLHVNGIKVADGSVHYFDPPMWQDLVGGDLVLA